MQWLKRRLQGVRSANRARDAKPELDVASRSLLLTVCLLIALDYAERRNHVRAGQWLAMGVLLAFPGVDIRRLTSNPRYLLLIGTVMMALVDLDDLLLVDDGRAMP